MRRRGCAAAVGVLAAVACAWFVLGIHDHDDLAAASRIAALSHPSAAQARHAQTLLHSARILNPDRSLAVTRAKLALARGDAVRARAILAGVVRAEPDDLQAWIELVLASADDPQVRALAFARALALTNTHLPTRDR